MRGLRHPYLLLLLLLLIPFVGSAQNHTPSDTVSAPEQGKAERNPFLKHRYEIQHTRVSTPTDVPVATVTSVPQHDPDKALLLSILPGAGQIYNGQAWKVPIVYGLLAGLGYWMYNSYNKMVDFREEYLLRIGGSAPQLEGYVTYPDASIYNLYQSNNQQFQLSIILSVVVYGLNLVDAYVYGHLFDFQIDEDLSLSVEPKLLRPTPYELCPTLSLSLHF